MANLLLLHKTFSSFKIYKKIVMITMIDNKDRGWWISNKIIAIPLDPS